METKNILVIGLIIIAVGAILLYLKNKSESEKNITVIHKRPMFSWIPVDWYPTRWWGGSSSVVDRRPSHFRPHNRHHR